MSRTYNNRTMVGLVKRRSEIVGELAKMSHDGWINARPDDYAQPETELRQIDERIAELDAEDKR